MIHEWQVPDDILEVIEDGGGYFYGENGFPDIGLEGPYASISFFVLSYLIRRRITEPIDELAAAAEEVVQGNLEVEVKVHEGGEFEGLERAFKEMVESFRKYIARSTGEE